MRKLLTISFILMLAMAYIPTFAAEEGKKGASAKAYEHASDQSIFNRVGDWFATIGKSPEEKEKILEERRAKRAAKRAEIEAKKAAKKAEKEAKKSKEKIKGKKSY